MCDISLVELPRLKLRFECKVHHSEGLARLHSLDYADYTISLEAGTATEALIQDLPHAVVLEDRLKQKFLLVPNYAVERVPIGLCPLNSELVLKCSEFQQPAAMWATDKWCASVQTRFYIYPVHLSRAFLQTPSLAAALCQ